MISMFIRSLASMACLLLFFLPSYSQETPDCEDDCDDVYNSCLIGNTGEDCQALKRDCLLGCEGIPVTDNVWLLVCLGGVFAFYRIARKGNEALSSSLP